MTDESDPDRLPYWAVVWGSAPVLGRWLAAQEDLQGLPVLELGCGPGLAGLAAAARGASVVQTDRVPEAVSLARRNARRNGLAVQHVAADWRAWPLWGRWPLVLASDVLYERAGHPTLLAVLGETVAPGGAALLADPDRPMSGDFFVRAEAAGWRVEALQEPEGGVWLWKLQPPPGGVP